MEGKLGIVIHTTLVLLFLPSSSIASNQGLGPYPTTNCFDDIPQINKNLCKTVWGLDDCSKSYTDKESFCFKICMLRKNRIIEINEMPPRHTNSESEESDVESLINDDKVHSFKFTAGDESINTGMLVSYYDINEYDAKGLENNPKFDQIEDAMKIRASKCEALSFVIPRQEYPCERFTPETKEKMEKLKTCIEETLKC